MAARKAGHVGHRSCCNVPAATGSANVLINKRAALRVGDFGVGRPGWCALDGAAAVLVNNRRAHRVVDAHEFGALAQGSANVLIGDHKEKGHNCGAARITSASWDRDRACTGDAVGITISTSHANGRSLLVEIVLDNHPEGKSVVDAFLLKVANERAECDWTCDIDWSDNPTAVELPINGYPMFRLIARLAGEAVDGGLLTLHQDLELRHAMLPPEEVRNHPLFLRLTDGSIRESVFDEEGRAQFQGLVPGPCRVLVPFVAG